MKYPVAVTVNGRFYRKEVEARTLLVDFLRDELGLTGTHVGCETSQCGACLVLLDGLALKACTRLAVQADGSRVTTLEGLRVEGTLHPAQSAILSAGALHCGFCAAGLAIAGSAMLDSNSVISEAEARRGLDGVLCRCTGYQRIVDGFRAASDDAIREALDGGAGGA